MHKSNRIIGAGTVIAMLMAAPVMAQTSAPLTPAGPAGISGATGLSVGTLAAIGAGALAVAAIATIASQSGNNAPINTSTATTS
ncbi:MAG TPA: hypothetical protein VNN98_06295 [Rhizomicrobium sp.]|nr:hypothetical protein [Rhizomicrobium sp.]